MTPTLDLTLTDGEREAAAWVYLQEIESFEDDMFEMAKSSGWLELAATVVDALAPLLLRAGAVKGIEGYADYLDSSSQTFSYVMDDEDWDEIRRTTAALRAYAQLFRSLTPPSIEGDPQ